MSKAKFAAAKELIAEKKYAEARSLLKTIDHPMARQWEEQLNKIDPPPKAKAKKARKVKVIRIRHGFFGNPNSRALQRAIEKWMQKGYELKEQDDQRGHGLRNGYTLLTFVELEKHG